MKQEEIIGKMVTNIYSIVTMEVGGLDSGECFIELDNKYIIDIPFNNANEIWLKDLNKNAVSLFDDLSDYPVYYINKNNKTVGEIAHKYQRKRRNFFNKLRKLFLGKDVVIKEYQPYKIEYRENKLKYIKNRKIVDYIWYDDDSEKGLILLDNGYLITETNFSPHGTGLAGLNYFENLESLKACRGNDYLKLSDQKGRH